MDIDLTQEEPAVAVAGLNVSRGDRRVLHGLDFAVARGRITGLLGPSGCGKCTLMRAIVGVQILETGEVTGARRGRPARRRYGRASATSCSPRRVYPDLSARENLRYFARVARRAGVARRRDARARAARRARRPPGGEPSPAGSGRGCRSARRCSAIPTCSCSTSRPSGSTRCCARTSGSTFHELAERRRDAARLEPRDGRGRALRRPAADARRLTCSPPDTRTELRERTGEDDMERAFLRLIDRKEVLV